MHRFKVEQPGFTLTPAVAARQYGVLLATAMLVLACGRGSENDVGGADLSDAASTDDGGSTGDTDTDSGSTGPGGDDLPPSGLEACEGIAGGYYPIENLPDAHGWQPSDGPACPGEPPMTLPPCWGVSCFETLLATACPELTIAYSLTGGLSLLVGIGSDRDIFRYDADDGTWWGLRTGVAMTGELVLGKSWIAVRHWINPSVAMDARSIDPETGLVNSLATFDGSKWGSQFHTGGIQPDDTLVFDSYPNNDTGERSLCRWRMGPFSWERIAGPIDDTIVSQGGAKVFDGWIYWANERVNSDTLEKQVIFTNSIGLSYTSGFTVIDDRMWMLVGSNCANTEAGCVTGGDGGLYYVDLEGPASEYPKQAAIQANAYDVLSSRLETDGERLFWQRRNYGDPMGFKNAQIVAFDPVSEELEVIFEFEEAGTGMSSYSVIDGYLYAVRHDAQLKTLGSLERLSLEP